MDWKPIIDDATLRKAAVNRLEKIYEHIQCDAVDIGIKDNLTFYEGKMGLCLFLYYCYKIDSTNKDWEKVLAKINQLIPDLNDENYHKYFVIYYMDFAWLVSHFVWQNDFDNQNDNFDEMLSGCDGFFIRLMEYYIETDNWDILSGATQIASYFLNKYNLKYERYVDYLILYIDNMYDKAIKDGNKFTWTNMIQKGDAKLGIPEAVGYNLGLAHGIPSLIMFFYKLKKNGIDYGKLDEMLFKACNYMLSTEQNIEIHKSRFSQRLWIDSDIREMSRIGWCYGDLGIGYALLHASEFNLWDFDMKAKSMEILYGTLDRKKQIDTLIVDDCLCHGTAGVALIYDLLYKKTGDDNFKKNALFWYEALIKQPYNDRFAGGYGTFKGYGKYVSDLTFLSGISGVGLALLSAIYPVSPDWTEFLILS